MLRDLRGWWNDHRIADSALAVVACGYLLFETPYQEQDVTDWQHLPLPFWGDLLAYAALAWRRRHPLPVLALVWTLWFAGGRWDVWAEWNASWAELGTSTALMLMFYTAGRWTSSGWPLLFLAGTLLPTALSVARAWTDSPLLPLPQSATPGDLFTMSFAACAGAWGLGRLRRSEMEAITRAKENQVQFALAEERVRIARELHDIVAHNVSAMVVQSDGATAALLDEDTAEAATAIEAIGQTGRTALGELRLLLGVLRDAPVSPQPGIDTIGDLVERLPLTVRMRVGGKVRETSAALGLAAYRIVQEALTNTLKHAGKDATADVVLRYEDDRLRIQVTDDGGNRPCGAPGAVRLRGSGHGLLGFQERAAMFGGTAHAAPLPHGGFRVEVTLSWK